MTGKLPVQRTIVDAYRFAFARFLSVLGTIWLPYLVLILIAFGLFRLMAPGVMQMLAAGQLDIAAGMQILRLAVIVFILAIIVGAMVTVDLQRKAMGTHIGPSWVFFSLRAPVWRMAAASILGFIVFVIVALVSGLACAAVWFVAGALGGAGALIRVLAVLATLAVIVYVALRLMFFLPAVVVAENSIGLERAWILGGSNFWRILIVTLAVTLPVVILLYLLLWAFAGPLPGPHDLGGQAAFRALLRSGAMQSGVKGYATLAFELLERILLLGLLNGAIASAYLAVGGNAGAPAAPAPAA